MIDQGACPLIGLQGLTDFIVEAFGVAVWLRLARRDIMLVDALR